MGINFSEAEKGFKLTPLHETGEVPVIYQGTFMLSRLGNTFVDRRDREREG